MSETSAAPIARLRGAEPPGRGAILTTKSKLSWRPAGEGSGHARLISRAAASRVFPKGAQVLGRPARLRGTLFQTKVSQSLLTITYGETSSYDESARQVGHVAAVRAVGASNRRNLISVVASYHRVVTLPPC